jgi:hypothetical protein
MARQFRRSQRFSGVIAALELAKHGDVLVTMLLTVLSGNIAGGSSRDRIFLGAC